MERQRTQVVAAAVAGVLVGAFTTAVLMYYRHPGAAAAGIGRPGPGVDPDDVVAVLDVSRPSEPAPIDPSVPTLSAGRGTLVEDLRARRLTLPVQGIDRARLASSFDEPRGGSRRHEAIDILAPRHTPVLAVEDGTVARLFTSRAGGITIYQYDPGERFVYYYAHLDRYADGLTEAGPIRRGQIIGYVGTSGNAPPNTPHLHFAIYELTDARRWWEGRAVDPYLVLR